MIPGDKRIRAKTRELFARRACAGGIRDSVRARRRIVVPRPLENWTRSKLRCTPRRSLLAAV